VLRDQPRTGHVPVMVLAEGDQLVLQKDLLEEGAYDFIEKPLDLDILSLRVRNALRRAEREGLTETRTGLPTGRLIEERLNKLDDEDDWYRIDLEIAEFGVFRDLYGFVTANEALRFAGNLMEQIVHEQGDPADFVGHFSGTEQFVVVTAQARGPALCDALVNRISDELQSFYNFMERDQGFVLVEDGSGGQVQKPLMSASATVTQSNPDAYSEDVWVDAIEEDDEPPEDASSGSTFEW
jgi:PleD family two-component response regulator